MCDRRCHHRDDQIDRDFLSSGHHALAAAVTEFAELHVRPRIPELEAAEQVNADLVREIARLGWIGATIPTCYGGRGGDHRAKVLIIDRLSRVSGAIGAAAQAGDIPVALFRWIATPEQRRRWLPALASGRTLATIAVTEPECGGYVLGSGTTATRDGQDYVLNGRKCFVGNSHVAGVHAVVARTGEDELSAFAVDSGADGLTLHPYRPGLGLRGFSFGDLDFDHVRVPGSARLGAQGDGLDAAYLASVVHGRLDIAAVALGLHHTLLEVTVEYAGGHSRLSRHETVQQRVGQIQSNYLTARQVVHHAAWLLDRGDDCDAELVNAKHVAVERGMESVRLAQEVFGARALRAGEPVERLARDLQHLWAPAGTADVQRYRLWQTATRTSKSSWSRRAAVR
ncbi:acyl-CoA dehydrogenase family protein [Saccharopolyspora gloriosae]|uniref:Alkylation response protein AidB-like acyl-CoA dehydrogenase n=1 Tax=Saccharopolyspora gloriosae TaxID=455344 RepID=A0A840NIL3_9PSEU|nr:acyl-CoA dehydrogenase family protein [Saccharopolyspora gloriosae]MBB5069012.1 alkylation response protein AidB-like acyl-CoA dehydrogenase [Saccharopolyspora gloriosae]